MDRFRQLVLDTKEIKEFVNDILSAAPEKDVYRPVDLQAKAVMQAGMSPYTQMFVPMLYIHMHKTCRDALLEFGWLPSPEAVIALISFIEPAIEALTEFTTSPEAMGSHPLGTLEVLNTHWMCSDVCLRYLQEV